MISPDEAVEMYTHLVKQDDSVMAASMAIVGAAQLWKGQPTTDLSPLLKVIDMQDMFAQADSFDKQVSFDGDVAVTGFFLTVNIFAFRMKYDPFLIIWPRNPR